ncbi:hypothetical protein A4A49_55415 [Nicotiana attenuata]|uniref:Uncharacterized protein n=1 Tax=Nicotiana attenuata TaxID=49451 RepID=A0A314KVE5_NICAT|nr:hypothetical protein A4A49_55415 [Nicotiana attenuata]
MPSSSPLSTHIRKHVPIIHLSPLSSPNVVVPIQLSPNNNDHMSLLYKYEIERISKELNHYIETGPSEKLKANDKQIRIKRSSKGWFRHGMMCRSRHDIVVESRVPGNPRLPEKHAPPGSGVDDVRFPSTEARIPCLAGSCIHCLRVWIICISS